MDENDDITLPFSSTKQNALIGHMMINERFFKVVHSRIKPNWFLGERNAQAYRLLLNFYDKYKFFPRQQELLNCPELLSMDIKERNILISYISRNIMETQQIRIDAIKPELTEWLHTVILMKTLRTAEKFFNSKDIKKCHGELMTGVKEVGTTTFEDGDTITFSDFEEYLKETKKEKDAALTTGLAVLDRALLSGAKAGGLLYRDTTIVMAPVNVGKSKFLITVACHNILQGKDVFFMTHEGDPKQIRNQFLSNMLGMPVEEVIALNDTDAGRNRIRPVAAILEKHLKYKPYNKAGAMFVERVVPIIRTVQEDWASQHNGKGFDLFVSDYPALLQTETGSKGMLPKRETDRIVYDNYVQLALEYGFHSLLAIQTNREGSKINKGLSNENRILEMEDVKESWDPMAEASNVLTLNRSPEAERKGILLINIAKSRTNAKGTVIVANSNYACNITHSDQLQGMAYSGSAMPDEIVSDIWGSWKEKAVAKPAPK